MVNTIFGIFKTASDEDPLADAKALAVWVEKQPANDDLGFQEAIVRVLEDMAARQRKVTPNRAMAVLELDRVSMPIQARLLKQFLLPSLSDSVRQRLWHTCDDVARWFAYIYENLFEALPESFLSQKAKEQLPGVAARMFYYRGQQAKNGLFRYERWVPGRWKSLHAGYETALKRGVARTPFALAPDSPALERTSAEQEVLQILLMQRVNTGNLRAAQIEMAASWLRAWAHTLALSEPPNDGAGFWLDLGLGDGLLTKKPQNAQGTLLYLDIAPLQKAIGDGLVALSVRTQRAGAPAAQADAAERRALLQRLEQMWRPTAKPIERRGARVRADRRVNVAAGLAQIAAALHGAGGKKEALFRHFRYGEPAEVASGRVQPTLRRVDQDAIEYERGSAGAWRLQDTSESGCKLILHSREAAQQKLGSLLGLQDDGDTRWKIGIVRRLKNFSGERAEIGVEIVAQNSLLVTPRPVASRDTGYSVDGIDVSVEGKGFDALYLAPMQSAGRAPRRSIVIPAPEYAERRRFLLTFNGTEYMVELGTALERTRDWVWSGFDIVAQG